MTGASREPRTPTASRLKSVTIAGPAGALEGLLQEHEGHVPALTAVVCHPHPLHGGSLHNKVVHRVASVLHGMGAAVLRFNFRGVGGSAGRFDAGAGELEDARAALDWIRSRHPEARRWLAGFSFGAWVAARLAAADAGVERLILIAPPVSREDFTFLQRSPVPKLVIQGTADRVCSPDDLEREFAGWAEPKTLARVDGASHFFDRQLGGLAEALRHGLESPSAGEVP